MNQLVIGKYISLKRKQKNMTQEQLAEKRVCETFSVNS